MVDNAKTTRSMARWNAQQAVWAEQTRAMSRKTHRAPADLVMSAKRGLQDTCCLHFTVSAFHNEVILHFKVSAGGQMLHSGSCLDVLSLAVHVHNG